MAAVRESCGNMKVGVYLKMKRIIAFAAAAVMLASMAGCGDSSSKGEAASSSVSSQAVYSAAASKLTSKMTETEKQRVNMHGLTLLDEAKVDENEQHKVGIAFHKVTEQEYLENLKMSLEQGLITQKQYDERKGEYTENSYPTVAYIDGQPTTADVMILQQFAESDGAVEFTVSDPKDPEKENTIKVNSFAEYLDWLKRYRLSSGSSEQAESAVKQAELIKKAFADNTYETVPEGDVQMNYGGYDPYIDYRSNWEFDRESAQQLKERIKEIDIYDEQLGTQFLAHVVLPKDYDKEKTYPVLFMTDGVYRFGDALRGKDERRTGDGPLFEPRPETGQRISPDGDRKVQIDRIIPAAEVHQGHRDGAVGQDGGRTRDALGHLPFQFHDTASGGEASAHQAPSVVPRTDLLLGRIAEDGAAQGVPHAPELDVLRTARVAVGMHGVVQHPGGGAREPRSRNSSR